MHLLGTSNRKSGEMLSFGVKKDDYKSEHQTF